MTRVNRDTLVSVAILLLMGFFFAATFAIPETSYDSMKPEVWPRVVIGFTVFWTIVRLVQSVRSAESPLVGSAGGFRGFLVKYRNPLVCFLLFGIFVAALPYAGILISGVLFVFATLAFIGEQRPKMLVVYAAIALVTVIGFWAIFTFLLGVVLPEGEILSIY